ncbi:MAG: arsenate reductase ArsC [Candidatus Sericytochromatia bacterium]|nr:arsenate reductase ArsC [Candidatus Sericytochromatia bacterium]
MILVLFACVHNAGRSRMAEALFNGVADPSKARALSAGTQPAAAPHPEVVATMREIGIELSKEPGQKLTPELAAGCRWLVTMGCGESCPVLPELNRVDWELPDPKGQPHERVRDIRETIRRHVEDLVRAHAWA